MKPRRARRNKPQIEIEFTCEDSTAPTVSNIDSATSQTDPNFQIFSRHIPAANLMALLLSGMRTANAGTPSRLEKLTVLSEYTPHKRRKKQ